MNRIRLISEAYHINKKEVTHTTVAYRESESLLSYTEVNSSETLLNNDKRLYSLY